MTETRSLDSPIPAPPTEALPPKKPRKLGPGFWAMIVLALLVGALIAAYELIASPFQAMVLAATA